MATIPSMPKAEDVVKVLRLKVSIGLGVVITLVMLGFMGLEMRSEHTHWQHLVLIFLVMMVGVGMIVPEFSLKFLGGAGEFLGKVLPFTKKGRKSTEIKSSDIPQQ